MRSGSTWSRPPERVFMLRRTIGPGSLAEVWVNGQKAGVIMAEPYTLDVTSLIRDGENEVELRVVGNMQNMIGPHHVAYDGIVDPNRWNVPTWRKASEYILTAVRAENRILN